MNLELCTDCVEGAVLAGRYGFQRIELCSALSEGGLTPSYGMIQCCAESSTAEVHAMIRSRGGSFTCDETELLVMQKDIKMVSEAGARGVVFGILGPNQEISKKNEILLANRTLLDAFLTDVRPIIYKYRLEKTLPLDPFNEFLTSGYQLKIEEERT